VNREFPPGFGARSDFDGNWKGKTTMAETAGVGERYRVWITAYKNWQPIQPDDVPPEAVALEPAEEDTMSAEQAMAYVTAFNREAKPNRWAVALPVTVIYRGDARRGKVIGGGRLMTR